ncbi:hypothetical protein LSH36_26g09042 [Paralvinella palmiformis]|uniref:Uncharacterized protein n=1 Tax=Paralvinella palmiformis TaxID=53620 RepID=A0AAD9KAK1_9ANNE|nr:hypothetical protein LSH36_26g09042 [Paralvinella palmiformis]
MPQIRVRVEFELTTRRLYDPDTVVYIDISREPSSWFESVYSWNKYGSAEQPFGVSEHINTSQTLVDCVQRQQECVKDLLYAGTLRFLCGSDNICHPQNYSEKSVSKAWQNVEDHYLTIGMLEDVPLFMETLEYLMPQMFSDINNAYLSVAETLSRRTTTLHKELLDDKSRKMLQSQLKYEYLLYTRLRDQFFELAAGIQKLKSYSPK